MLKTHLHPLAALAALTWVFFDAPVSAAETTESSESNDKSGYHLFKPTPAESLRELSADRPDKTDSPYTVDAGHFQLEMDAFNYTIDRRNPQHTWSHLDAFEIGAMNLKAGVANNVDVQLVLTAYRHERLEERDEEETTVEKNSGFGDLTPRLKVNLWGNDGGRTALAVMPYVKLPTARKALGNGVVEGGVKFPFAIDVPEWDISLMTEFIWNRNENDDDYHTEFVNTISVGHKLLGPVSLYAELYTNVSTETDSPWVGTLDTWLTYEVNKNLRLDGGVYIGLTRAAEDWHPFVGLTYRR